MSSVAQRVISADHLDHSRLKNTLSQLYNFQCAVWGVGTWLDNDGIAGQNRGNNLAERQEREGPRTDGSNDFKRRVPCSDSFPIIFRIFVRYRQL